MADNSLGSPAHAGAGIVEPILPTSVATKYLLIKFNRILESTRAQHHDIAVNFVVHSDGGGSSIHRRLRSILLAARDTSRLPCEAIPRSRTRVDSMSMSVRYEHEWNDDGLCERGKFHGRTIKLQLPCPSTPCRTWRCPRMASYKPRSAGSAGEHSVNNVSPCMHEACSQSSALASTSASAQIIPLPIARSWYRKLAICCRPFI